MPACTSSRWVDFHGNPIRRVVQLARVSGQRQEEEETVKTQVAVMNRFCQSNEWLVLDRCADENCQNETPLKERNEGGRLWRRLAEPDFEAIVVYTVDRWSREPHVFWPEYHFARTQGVRLISATQACDDTTDEGRLMMGVLLSVGSYEKSQITRKFASGKRRVLDERQPDGYGYWLGGVVPYGYREVLVGRRHALLVDDELLPGLGMSPADVIRMIFRWCVEEHGSARLITGRLNDRGIPTHSALPPAPGRPSRGTYAHAWHTATVVKILRSTIYAGRHFYGKRGADGYDRFRGVARPMPAIIAEETWQAAQQVLRENTLWADRNKKRDYLLSGKIRCASPGCGYTFYGRTNNSPGQRRYYVCTSAIHRRQLLQTRGVQCQCQTLRADELEAFVLTHVQGFIDRPSDTVERLRQKMQESLSDTRALAGAVDDLRRQLSQKAESRKIAQRALLAGRFTDQEYDERVAEIETDEHRLAREIADGDALLTKQHGLEAYMDAAEQFLLKLQGENGRVASWPFAAQRRLVETWVDQVVIYPPGTHGPEQEAVVRFWFADPIAIAKTTSAHALLNYAAIIAAIHCGVRRNHQ